MPARSVLKVRVEVPPIDVRVTVNGADLPRWKRQALGLVAWLLGIPLDVDVRTAKAPDVGRHGGLGVRPDRPWPRE